MSRQFLVLHIFSRIFAFFNFSITAPNSNY